MSAQFCFSVDDCCVPGFSSPKGFLELLEFLDEQKVPGAFFVAPFTEKAPLSEKPEWLKVIREALTHGHDVQLHGLEHYGLEFGIPPRCILSYEDEIRKRVTSDRISVERGLRKDILSRRLSQAIELFEAAVGYVPCIFRSPFASTHPNFFRVLKESHIEIDTSLIVDPRGWKFITNDYGSPIDWNEYILPEPFGFRDIIEIPIMSEFTFYLKKEHFEKHLNLAKEDLDRTRELNGVFVSMCHVDPITGRYAIGLEMYRRLFKHARDFGDVNFGLLKDVAGVKDG